MPALPRSLGHVSVLRILVAAMAVAALALAFMAAPAQGQWPTTCVELNDLAERALGNHSNVGIYQRVFGDQAEQACQNDHRADVQAVFAWAIPTPAPAPAPAAAPAPPPPVPASPPIGHITQLVASPFVFQDETIWLGTATGGVLRSTNAGASFSQFTGGLPNLTVNAILPSPDISNDGVVLVATNAGVARSTNRGESWASVAGLPGGRVGALAASARFATDRTLFAVADAGGLYQSTDGGATWSAVPVEHANGLAPGAYLGMTTAEGRGEKSIVFAWTSVSIFFSDNAGRGFKHLIGRKALPDDLRISAVAVHPKWRNNEMLWVGSELHGLYRTTNGGEEFERVLKNPDNSLGRINAIALSPLVTRDGTLAVGTSKRGVYVSKRSDRFNEVTDVGGPSSWNHRSVNLKINDVRGVAFSNGYFDDRSIYAGGEVQVARSHSRADTWYTYPNSVGPTS